EIRNENIVNLVLSSADITAIQTDLAVNGFPPQILDDFLTLGLSDDEIQAILGLILNASPTSLTGDLFGTLQMGADASLANAAALNEPPIAFDESVVTSFNTPTAVLLTGVDPEGDSLSFTVTSNPAHGGLSGTPPNLTYTPNSGYTGSDAF